jgi:hypothetical protein
MAVTSINLELKELDKLREKLGAPSRADVVRRALALLNAAVDHSVERTISIGEGTKKVKVIL